MGGILKNLQKKGKGSPAPATELFVRSSNENNPPEHNPTNSEQPNRLTTVATTDAILGSAEQLISELRAESRMIVKESQTADNAPAMENTMALTRTKIKLVHAEGEGGSEKSSFSDSKLPWWITDYVPASPQVDVLVPAARSALNEIITERTTPEEMPIAVRKAVNAAATKLASEVRLSGRDIESAVDDLLSLMTGKGPLQALYDDNAVTDIYMDGYSRIRCLRRGHALETPFKFRSADEYEAYVNSILQGVERVLNLSSPIVDVVLNDKWRSRVSAVHYSVLDSKESGVVIRIPRLQQITFYDLLQTKTLPPTVAAWLSELVCHGEANILVMGPTGSGKTVFTTALLSAVSSDERICTIEDVPEIFVPTAHLEKLVSRPENAQGKGSVALDQLLRAALRRAPHRIVVGEIRDKEAPLFLKALETGHMGSIATIHAFAPKDGLWRLLDLVSACESSPQDSIQRRISRSVNILVSMQRVNGRPCMVELAEVQSPINGEFIVRNIVQFEGEVAGKRSWRLTANQSIWIDKLKNEGIELQLGPMLNSLEGKSKNDLGASKV